MGTIILHKGKRVDTGEEVTGFLTKMWGQYHIILEDNENTAYPVEEKSISPYLKPNISDTGKEESSLPPGSLEAQPNNRWYFNNEMLPRLQDTVLICKGWYDKEKYENTYEALRAYWAKLCKVDPEDICYDHILNALLLPACEAFLNKRQFCEIFYDRIFKQDIVLQNMQMYLNKVKNNIHKEMNTEYLIDLLTNALFKLRRDEFQYKRMLEAGYCVI